MTRIDQLEMSPELRETLKKTPVKDYDWECAFRSHQEEIYECITRNENTNLLLLKNTRFGTDMMQDLNEIKRETGENFYDLLNECLHIEQTFENALKQKTLDPSM